MFTTAPDRSIVISPAASAAFTSSDVGTACEESCEQFGDDATMKACADVCRSCSEMCRKMARAA